MHSLIQKLNDMLGRNDRLLVHVMGGQDKKFFQLVGNDDGFEILFERSILNGICRIFSFIPSREGLLVVETRNLEVLIPRLLELNSGVALLEFYAVPETLVGDFEKYFCEREIQLFLERTPSIRSLVSNS